MAPMALAVKTRYYLLDALRGCAMISMVLYHFCYDWLVITGTDTTWFTRTPVFVWEQSICWSFILLAGACTHFSRRPFLRGLQVFGCGMAVTLVTYIALPSQVVWFGVLHFMGAALMLHGLLRRLAEKIPCVFGLCGCLALFGFFHWATYSGRMYGWGPMPGFLDPLRIAIGMPPSGFFSSDYFSLLPWLFLFYAGYFVWPMVKQWRLWQFKVPVLCSIGRYSLLVYMLHQPVLYGITLLLA